MVKDFRELCPNSKEELSGKLLKELFLMMGL
jgi:hypothetical protein